MLLTFERLCTRTLDSSGPWGCHLVGSHYLEFVGVYLMGSHPIPRAAVVGGVTRWKGGGGGGVDPFTNGMEPFPPLDHAVGC